MKSLQALLLGLVVVLLISVLSTPALAKGDDKVEEGGTIYARMSSEPPTLNPLTYKDVYGSIIIDDIFETLLERDLDTLEFKGRLAERWEVSEDGLKITFHLNPKARFSDGKPLTAADVVFTYETIKNPRIDAHRSATYFKDCEAVERVDSHTVRFVWKKRYFKSLEVSGTFPVLPKHIYAFKDPEKFNEIRKKLIGSGHYLFDHWDTGQELVLVRNERYWGKKPSIKRIVYKFIAEEQAAVQALRSGNVDFISLSPEWYKKLKKGSGKKNYRLYRYSAPGNGYAYIAWNNARAPFTDRRVRMAMTYLIWRPQIVKSILLDMATVITGPFWTQSPQYDKSIKPWPFDRAKALALLAKAGWKDHDGDGWLDRKGKRLSFEFSIVAGNQQTREIARMLKGEFRRVGIEMNTRAYEWSVFVGKLDQREYDAIMLGWTGSVEGDPFQIWHSSQIEHKGSNHVSFKNAESDALIEKARVTMDSKKRNALYHKFQRILHREQPYTFLWTRESLRAINTRIRGVKVHKLGQDRREWWIPKSRRRKN